MKKVIAAILAFIGIGSHSPANEPRRDSGKTMQGLRQMVLELSPDAIGLTQQNFPYDVWGVLMETGTENGAFSLVALGDGSTSLYFSNGGGIIGTGEHASVKKASSEFLGMTNKFLDESKPASTYPLPKSGDTIFYFLTFHGIKTYAAKEVEFGEGRDSLSVLFHAGHAVIAEIRQASGK